MTALKVVCAYCKTTITEGPAYPVSHGACDACFVRLMAEIEQVSA